jgi:hypothetical protein
LFIEGVASQTMRLSRSSRNWVVPSENVLPNGAWGNVIWIYTPRAVTNNVVENLSFGYFAVALFVSPAVRVYRPAIDAEFAVSVTVSAACPFPAAIFAEVHEPEEPHNSWYRRASTHGQATS